MAVSKAQVALQADRIIKACMCRAHCTSCQLALGRSYGKVHCPAHEDNSPSLSVSLGEDRVLVNCKTGCSQDEVIDALIALDAWPTEKTYTEYSYCDADGNEVFQSVKVEETGKKKRFFQRHWSDAKGDWIYDMKGVKRVVYRLPELLGAGANATVFAVEGEKDVDRLGDEGLVATTNVGGADNWLRSDSAFLAGLDVVVCGDNDDAGRDHVTLVERWTRPQARSLVVLDLLASEPNLPAGGDISDWLDMGHEVPELLGLVDEARARAAANSTNGQVTGSTAQAAPSNQAAAAPPDDEQYTRVNLLDGFHGSPDGNVQRLIAEHGEDFRFVAGGQYPLIWSKGAWQDDETRQLERWARQTLRKMYVEAGRDTATSKERKALVGWALRSETHKALIDMLALSQNEAGMLHKADAFDADPLLLNVLNGTIDLRTGKRFDHDPKLLLRRQCPVVYDPHARCPEWLTWLKWVTCNDPELVQYLQRAIGYTLTGLVGEQIVLFLFGGGQNGKSTLVDVLTMLLGNYGHTARIESFLVDQHRSGGGPSSDIADLAGPRFVHTSENPRRRPLNEARIKELTSGEEMRARYLHREAFSFYPRLKLWLSTNHLPPVGDTDEGIWRRIRAIPFENRVKPSDLVLDYSKKFEPELPGILNWAVQGCLDWQRYGMGKAKRVIQASRDYRSSQDVIQNFLDERCERGDGRYVEVDTLYQSYVAWANGSGERPESKKALGQDLTRRGINQSKSHNPRVWEGLGLQPIVSRAVGT